MDGLSSSHIQSQVAQAQQEGARTATGLFGAAATGKADEAARDADDAGRAEEDQKAQENDAPEPGASGNDEAQETFLETGEETGALPCPGETPELSDEALKAAEATVRKEIDGETASPELSRMKPAGEPRSPDLAIAGSIAVMDIHDLMSGRPLPPILDDPYDTHMGGV